MKRESLIGVNYWPIDSAMNWWRCFDAARVREDFSRIREAELHGVRIFLLWEDFQPLPKKVSVLMLNRLVTVMEIAQEAKLKIIPTFFTGHMSGLNYLPPWMLDLGEAQHRFAVFSEGKRKKNPIRNFYVDREIVEAQKLLLREVSGALSGHRALWAWDLGNEPSNVVLPPSREAACVWLEEMVTELKKRDETIPVTLGLHQEDLEGDRRLGPKEAASFCDFLSIHAYSIYARWADGPLDPDVVPFLASLTQWLGSKEVLIEEVGIPSSRAFKEGDLIVSEERAVEYYEHLLQRLKGFGGLGVLFWCYGDYAKPLWDEPPFDQHPHERFFGLFREDCSPKSFLPMVKGFRMEKGRETGVFDWIDIEPEAYFNHPKENLSRLYWRFKEQGLS